jgi:hypothetical protein
MPCHDTAPDGLGWIKDVWDIGREILDGGGGTTHASWLEWPKQDCPGMPSNAAILSALERAPSSLVDTLLRAIRAANGGMGPLTRTELMREATMHSWIGAVFGGRDCKHSGPNGPAQLDAFRAIMAYAGAGGFPATSPPPPSDPGLLERLGATGARILQEILGATSAEAAADVYASLPEEQRRAIEAEILRRRLGPVQDTARSAIPWVLGLGLVGAVLVARR